MCKNNVNVAIILFVHHGIESALVFDESSRSAFVFLYFICLNTENSLSYCSKKLARIYCTYGLIMFFLGARILYLKNCGPSFGAENELNGYYSYPGEVH